MNQHSYSNDCAMTALDARILQAALEDAEIAFCHSPMIRLTAMLEITRDYQMGGAWFQCFAAYNSDEVDTNVLIESIKYVCEQMEVVND